jgi:hypothetical protein
MLQGALCVAIYLARPVYNHINMVACNRSIHQNGF